MNGPCSNCGKPYGKHDAMGACPPDVPKPSVKQQSVAQMVGGFLMMVVCAIGCSMLLSPLFGIGVVIFGLVCLSLGLMGKGQA